MQKRQFEEEAHTGCAFQDGLDDLLAAELGGETLCAHCGNPLVLNFNTVRDGWQVHCSYCGANGPCERLRQDSIEGYISFVRL